MKTLAEEIKKVFLSYKQIPVKSVEKLPQSGGDRVYFRIRSKEGTHIGTYNHNIKENETFLRFSEHFKQCAAPVPEILKVSDDRTMYIQQDFGDDSLLTNLELHGHTPYVYSLFQKSLKKLAFLQVEGHKDLDYNWCITSKEFGKQAIVSDLLYFKYYFFDTLKIHLLVLHHYVTALKIPEHKIFVFHPGEVNTQRFKIIDERFFVVGYFQCVKEIIFKIQQVANNGLFAEFL